MPSETGPNSSAQDFTALRDRYRVERERRAPGEGERSYLDMGRGFQRLLDDPYAAPGAPRGAA